MCPTTTARRWCGSADRSSCRCSSTASASSPTRRGSSTTLEERFPEPPLFPSDRARREELRAFLDWFNGLWKRPPNLIVAEESKPEPDRERIAELERRIASALPRFEALLDGRHYLFGDELTAADVMVFPFLKYAALWEEGDEHRFHEVLRDAMRLHGRYPRLEAWIHRIDALPRA